MYEKHQRRSRQSVASRFAASEALRSDWAKDKAFYPATRTSWNRSYTGVGGVQKPPGARQAQSGYVIQMLGTHIIHQTEHEQELSSQHSCPPPSAHSPILPHSLSLSPLHAPFTDAPHSGTRTLNPRCAAVHARLARTHHLRPPSLPLSRTGITQESALLAASILRSFLLLTFPLRSSLEIF